jgi:hypothetical protein
MLSDLISAVDSSDLTLDFIPDLASLETTSLLDAVATVSSEAEAFLTDGLSTLETATGELAIASGVISGELVTAAGESFVESFDAPTFFTEAATTIAAYSGELSLADGVVNAVLEGEGELFAIDNFDLATFAAEGFEFLVSSLETTIPIENGVFLIDAETAFGSVDGFVDVTGGDLDIVLNTFAGTLDVSLDFGPESQFAIPIPVGETTIDAVVNLDSGNIEIPLLPGTDIEIPLSSLSGELVLSQGISTLSLDTQFGPVSTEFDVSGFVAESVVDALTGLTADAGLIDGQLDLVATSGDETFQTDVDLLDLNAQVVDALLQTDGSLSLGSGVVSGLVSLGEDALEVDTTIGEISDVLTTPIASLLKLSPTV